MHIELNHVIEGDERRRLRLAVLDALACADRAARLARLRALSGDELLALRAFAKENRVEPIVAAALREAGEGWSLDEDGHWERIYERSGGRMRALMAELDRVAAALAPEGIRMVALKNAGIARGIYPDPAACPMGDLDVLVDKARFREAHRIILEQGFRLAARGTVESADLEEGLLSGGTEYVKESGGEEVWFELQWRPVAGRWIRKDQEPDASELLERSVEIPGSAVRLLAPVDNMIQVALHTAKHTYVRAPGLRLHTDVERLAHYAPPDWDAVVAMATRLEVKTATYFSFALARALLDAPVPDHVLAALAPPAWKREAVCRWLRKVDLFYPDERKFNRPGMMAFHALMYDDVPGLAASAFGTDRSHLGLRHLPANLRRGATRVTDLVRRYQA